MLNIENAQTRKVENKVISIEDYLMDNGIVFSEISLHDLGKIYSFFSLVPKAEEMKIFGLAKSSLLTAISTLFLTNQENFIDDLFSTLDLKGENAVQNVQTLREILVNLFGFVQVVGSAYGMAGNKMYDLFDKKIQAGLEKQKIKYENVGEDANFFAVTELRKLLQDFSSSDSESRPVLDVQDRGVFSLSDTIYASFNWDRMDDEEIYITTQKTDNYEEVLHSGKRVEEYLEQIGITDQHLIYQYKRFLRSPYREIFKDIFGYDLSEFNLLEQFFIIQLVKSLTIENQKELSRFAKTYGKNGMKVLMSSEFNRDIFQIDGLVDLANYCAWNHADLEGSYLVGEIFKIYIDTVAQTENIDDFLGNANVQGKTIVKLTGQEKKLLQKNIRNRSNGILVRLLKFASTQLDQASMDERNYGGDLLATVKKKLGLVNPENVLLAEVFKFFKQANKDISLRDLETIKLIAVNPDNTSENLADDISILNLYRQNYSDKRANNLYKKLLEDSKKPGFTLLKLEHKGELLSFVYVIEDQTRKSVYLGGINSSPKEGVQNLMPGNYLMNLLEEKYSQEDWKVKIIAALNIVGMYISRRGFIATKILEDSEEGETRFELTRDSNLRYNTNNPEEVVFNRDSLTVELNKKMNDDLVIVGVEPVRGDSRKVLVKFAKKI